jgi:hypothetical protein
MQACRRWSLILVGAGIVVLAGCDDRKGGSWFNQDAANPAAGNRQRCADAGFEPGSVQFMQCMGQGRGLPRD